MQQRCHESRGSVPSAKSRWGSRLAFEALNPLQSSRLSASGNPVRIAGTLALSLPGRFETVFSQPIVERGAGQSQDLGGLRDQAAGRAEDGVDVATL